MSSENSKEIKLKGLDFFQAKVGDFIAGLAQNPKPLLAIGALILVALLAGSGFQYFSHHSEDERRLELSKIDQVFDDEIKTYSKQREALEKQRDTLKAAQPQPAAEAKDAKPLEDSLEIKALDAQITALKADHTGSSDQYKKFYEANPKVTEGWVAGLKYAAYVAEKNNLDEAAKILEELVKDGKGHAILQTQALLLLISIQEDRNELDKALEHAEALYKVASNELKPRALLSKAQIYFLKKDDANTKTTATKLVTDHENSPEADRARSLLALLPE
jgi:predicted negative regulator of RcsB-dependent stress response